MSKLRIALALILCVCVVSVSAVAQRARKQESVAGWIPMSQWDRAVKMAEKADRPILVLEKFAQSSCPLHNSRARTFQTFKQFNGFVKVVTHIGGGGRRASGSPELEKALDRTRALDNYLPRITCVDARCRFVGSIPYETGRAQLPDKVKILVRRFKQMRSLDKKVSKGEKLLAQGSFTSALKLFTDVAKGDPEGELYPDIVGAKTKEINTRAEGLLTEAEALMAKGDYVEAGKIVDRLVRNAGGFEFLDRARKLQQHVKDKLEKGDEPDETAKPMKRTVLTGLLRGDIAAIGGETTGYEIQYTNPDTRKLVLQEVSGDRKLLTGFVGKKVRANGYYFTKHYVERGAVKVFHVESMKLVR